MSSFDTVQLYVNNINSENVKMETQQYVPFSIVFVVKNMSYTTTTTTTTSKSLSIQRDQFLGNFTVLSTM
jgi:hypothetical protein